MISFVYKKYNVMKLSFL